ncbi:pre-mRNA processing factor 3-domain-containing protein [Phycomyces blakesleeanus]|uniref:Pre-mRNA processing factor 3-domain-containing protein n=1 Tax=Phycomyces blakesleeanus TaxID=4837 RepID=A0ABR3AV91_PHYBL
MASFQSKAAAQTKAAPPPRPKVPVSVPNSISSWRPPPLPVNIPQPVPEASTGGLNLLELKKRIAETKARMGNAPASAARGVTPVVDTRGNGPQVALDESGNLDLKAMLDRGIIPKRENALAKPAPRPAAPKKELKVLKLESPPEELTDPTKNPYFDPSLIAKTAPVSRRARSLKFVRPGKYIQQANQERAKAQLEKLKQEISENVKKAGMEVELDISDKAIKKEPPPAIEWWDAPFMPNKTYSDLDTQPVNPDSLGALVTLYVHHPIPIKPPSELTGPAVSRSLMLTKKERKKLRRQQRQETQKEKQDKIRLGLLPPDPPKVKISNLMRVLGDEAIQDPTKIEAKVRKEMELRQKQHETANEQRKLTPAERRAKIANKLKNDQKISNEVAVFK